MKIKRKIRVLIVDDSLLFRETLAKALSKDPGMEIVGTASDPYEARDKIIDLRPDVITLDVEMPRMDGITFLRKLMPQYPVPVVVVSSVNGSVFDALNAGAIDFVSKPQSNYGHTLEHTIQELLIKIKVASVAKVGHHKLKQPTGRIKSKSLSHRGLIAIGASTGGTEALFNILKVLPQDMPGIVVVQHMPPVFTRLYAERLNNSCLLEVKEAANGDEIRPGRVLIAPGDYHMVVKNDRSSYHVECYHGEKINGHCPSVDVLFNSVAEIVGKNTLGIILTGMGYDGAKGLLSMRKKGAITLGQNEETCVVYGMPRVANSIGAVELELPLEKIPQAVISCISTL